ncbi:MAG: bifunctional 2-C-methyl-D-erythritol 4-phosphate cytidylyltransferase/2-C-methyl-D-erythritol 2,4-cyclodiphosphate synthase [Sphingomonadaceae bacterium]|nr:bifunctional 2-C-methyl-D-erythritol 4-phosphate cytidylyltransferase/2-C-methyl-D-erythritol 2,4-cyclodiphosphate synthase [Sphingomonadaceae bacterium]
MEAEGKFAAIIVAGGTGSRSGLAQPKQFALLGAKPVLAWSIDAFAAHPRCTQIILVVPADHFGTAEAIAAGRVKIVHGGDSRQASVAAGLAALGADAVTDAPYVLIHDAARPGLHGAVIDRLLGALDAGAPGAVPTIPIADSVAEVMDGLGDYARRENLARVQTPQAFVAAQIIAAHANWAGPDAGDDAQMLRATGAKVALVSGDPLLGKITHIGDLERVGAMLGQARISVVGSGFDVHRLVAGDGLWLGGYFVPHHQKLDGHSDADVLLHAITDAILGTVAAGDIGQHFPPSDPRWRGAASDQFVRHAMQWAAMAGVRITHVDATIICEAPKIGPHREAIRARLAEILGLPLARISLKATTSERLGFTGRGEGIAAQASVSAQVWDVP